MKLSRKNLKGLKVFSLILSLCLILVLSASVFIRMQNNASADQIFVPVTNDTVIYQGKVNGVDKTYIYGDATETWDIGVSESNMMVAAYYEDDDTIVYYGSDSYVHTTRSAPFAITLWDLKNILTYNYKPLGNCDYMFSGFSSYPTTLEIIDLSGLDASEITSLNNGFQNIASNGQTSGYDTHTSIILPKHLNTDKVTEIDYIFQNAFVGNDIDVTWPEEILFPNATTAENAFGYFLNSSKEDYTFNFLEHFDFSNVLNCDLMFCGMFMYSEGNLNLSFKDKDKVFCTKDTTISALFNGFCQGTHGDVKIDFGKGMSFAPDTEIDSFWDNLGYRSEGNFEVYFGDHFDGSNVTAIDSFIDFAFGSSNCSYKLDFGKHFDFSNATFDNFVFSSLGCSSTNSDIYIDFGDNFDISNFKDYPIFCNLLCGVNADNVTIDLGDNFNASGLCDVEPIFVSSFGSSQINNLTIDFGKHFDISNKETLETLFSESFNGLKFNKFKIDFGENFDIKDGISGKNIFLNAFSGMTKIGDDSEFIIDFNKFDGSQFGSLSEMFKQSFAGIQVDNILVDFGDNFNACNALSALDMFAMSFAGKVENFKIDCGKNFNLCSATNIRQMFYELGYASSNSQYINNAEIDLGDNFNACSATNVSNFAFSYSDIRDNIKFYGGKNFNLSGCSNFNYFMASIASNGNGFKPNIYIDLGDNFNAINGESFNYAFERIGYDSTGKDIYISLGKNFNKSDDPNFVPKALNMGYMFAYVGYYAKSVQIDLGENFITDNVSNFQYMFYRIQVYGSNVLKFELTLPKCVKFDNAENISSMFTGILSTISCKDVTITFNNDFHFTKNCDASLFMKESFYLVDNIKVIFNGDIIVEPDVSVNFWEAFRNVAQMHSVNTIFEFNGDVLLKGNTNISEMFQYFGGYSSFWGPDTKTRITFNKDLDLSGVTQADSVFGFTSMPKEESIIEVKGNVTPAVLTSAYDIFNSANFDTVHLDYFNFDGNEGSGIISNAKTWSIVVNKDTQNTGTYYFNNANDNGTSKWYAVTLDGDNNEVYTEINYDDVCKIPGAIRYDRRGQLDSAQGIRGIDRKDGLSKTLFTIDTAHTIGDLYDIKFAIFNHGAVDHLEEGIDYEVEATNGESLIDPTAPGESINIHLNGINRYEKFLEYFLVIEPYEIQPEDLTLEYVTEENPVIKKQDGTSKITSSLKMVYKNPKTGEKVYFDVNEGNYTKDGSNYTKSDANPLDITIKGLKISSKNNSDTLNRYTLTSVNNYNVPITFSNVGKIDKKDDNGNGGNGGNGGNKTITTSTITVQIVDPVIKGYSDNTIRPNNNITRQEFITMLSRLDSSYSKNIDYTKHINNLSDVLNNNNIYAKNEIGYYIYKGIIKGYPDGTFKPNGLITRAEASKVLCMYKNIDTYTNVDITKATNQFNDVINSNWFTNYVATLYNKGYINGRKQNSFEPNGYLTRAEAAKLICLLENRNMQMTNIQEENNLLNKYKDLDKNEWYFPYIYQLTK